MKIQINPFHKINTWICIVLLFAATLPPKAVSKAPKDEGAGVALGVTVLVCAGVVVYCLVRTCKKLFGTNTNHFQLTWSTNQSPNCYTYETCVPCDICETNAPLKLFAVIHELQRTTNLTDWDIIDTQYGNIDELYFYDPSPVQGNVVYRIVSW